MTRQWDEPSILQELTTKVGSAEAGVASRIIEWAKTRNLGIRLGKGRINGTVYLVWESTCEPVTIVTTGNIMIPFVSIRQAMLLDDESKVNSFLNRLNNIPGVAFRDATTFRFIPLRKLMDQRALNQFLDTLDWLITASKKGRETNEDEIVLLPGEIVDESPLFEGATCQVLMNAYERNPEARRQCIAQFGADCCICGFNFGRVYGQVAEGFIHVHHLRPLSEIGAEYKVDPIEDLRPVCPNCHAVLHRRIPAYSIEEVKAFLARR